MIATPELRIVLVKHFQLRRILRAWETQTNLFAMLGTA